MDDHQSVTNDSGLESGQWVPMASWGRRLAARLIDDLVYLLAYTPYLIGWLVLADASPGLTVISTNPVGSSSVDLGTLLLSIALMLLGTVLGLVVFIWNRVIQQGRTGQSIGKSVLNIYLVSARTGTPIGAGTSFLREIVHIVDGLFYVGYLWPLWDRQKQTFADKILGTVVAHAVPATLPDPAAAPILWAQPDGGDDTLDPGAIGRPLPQ